MVEVSSKDPESRSREEVLKDRAMLLFLIDECNKFGRMDGDTKLNKIVFLAEEKLNELGKKFLNYSFFRYNYGPFSKAVANDANHFRENDLVSLVNGRLVPTDRGEEVISLIRNELREEEAVDIIDEEVQKLADLQMSEVKKKVYSKTWDVGGEEMEIRDIPKYTDLMKKLDQENAEAVLDLDNESLATIEHLMDKKGYDDVNKGLRDIREGNLVEKQVN